MALSQYRAKAERRGDIAWIFLIIGLALFGLLMISSASVVISYEYFNSNTIFLSRQATYFGMALIAMIITSLVDYRVWRTYAKPLFFIAFFLVVLVEIPGVGVTIGGAQRWLSLGPILVQPSEIIKLGFIIYLASWLELKHARITNVKEGILPFIVLLAIVAGIIVNEPDLGTALVVTAAAGVMLFVAGASYIHFIVTFICGTSLVYLLIRTSEYRWQRFLTFLNPLADLQGAGYQINQALIAIGSGGLFGLGFGQSRQKYLYLPQAQTDAIFAVMVEELGFIRVALIIGVFLWLGFKGFGIAKQAPDMFSKLVVTGVTTWILFQAFVNIGGVMGVLPLTGIPLPFISYGGSSLIALFAGAGIVYNISRHTAKESA